jgi:MFS transporter, CP family, cyanate transporter
MRNKSRLRAPTLLWLSGVVLRITILAIAPVIPLIQRDLHMSGTQVGILSGLPTLMLALAAILGAFAMSRFSAFATLIGGLVLVALGTILRSTADDITVLFGTTVVMSTGVAIAQPTLAVLVREWLPRQIGFGTASYANGLIVGGIIPIALMLPVVMPLLGDSWRLAIAVWSAPVLLVIVILLLFAPRSSARGAINVLTPADWFSLDYNLIWRIGLIFGANNSIFFGTNAFLPSYLTSIGKSDLISGALTVYNFCQLPSSLLAFAFASRLERRIWPYLFAGLLAVASIAFTISRQRLDCALDCHSGLCKRDHIDAGARPTTFIERPRSNWQGVGCHVYDQLYLRDDDLGMWRRLVGHDRTSRCRTGDGCNRHPAAVDPCPDDSPRFRSRGTDREYTQIVRAAVKPWHLLANFQ